MAPTVALRCQIPQDLLSDVHLLITLNFIKEYRSSAAASLSFGYRAESTFEDYAWTGLQLLDSHLPNVLQHSQPRCLNILTVLKFQPGRRFLFPRPGGVATDALSTIDGTFCPRRSTGDPDLRRSLIGPHWLPSSGSLLILPLNSYQAKKVLLAGATPYAPALLMAKSSAILGQYKAPLMISHCQTNGHCSTISALGSGFLPTEFGAVRSLLLSGPT